MKRIVMLPPLHTITDIVIGGVEKGIYLEYEGGENPKYRVFMNDYEEDKPEYPTFEFDSDEFVNWMTALMNEGNLVLSSGEEDVDEKEMK